MSDTFGFVLNVKGGIEKKMDKSNKRKLYNYYGEMSDQDEKIVMGKTNLFHYYFWGISLEINKQTSHYCRN